MAKTIKFNLICDGKPIRTIEDLQNNFSVEDILAYYDNKLLHRWLEVRGYEKELGEVNKINAVTSVDKIKCLAKIFEIDTEEEKIADAIYTIEKIASKQDLYSEYEKHDFDPKIILDKYMDAYKSLVKQIIANRDDFEKVKSLVEELITKHYDVFQKNYFELFFKFYTVAPKAVLALLVFEKSRNHYINTEIKFLEKLNEKYRVTIYNYYENILEIANGKIREDIVENAYHVGSSFLLRNKLSFSSVNIFTYDLLIYVMLKIMNMEKCGVKSFEIGSKRKKEYVSGDKKCMYLGCYYDNNANDLHMYDVNNNEVSLFKHNFAILNGIVANYDSYSKNTIYYLEVE